MTWNHMDNTYFLPASYMKHVIGTYSSVTDAVICMKNPSHSESYTVIDLVLITVLVILIFIIMSDKTYLQTNVSEVHMAPTS